MSRAVVALAVLAACVAPAAQASSLRGVADAPGRKTLDTIAALGGREQAEAAWRAATRRSHERSEVVARHAAHAAGTAYGPQPDASLTGPRQLYNGAVVVGHAETKQYAHYFFNNPGGSGTEVVVSSHQGDPDLFASCGAGSNDPYPTKGDSQWSSQHPGGAETIRLGPGECSGTVLISVLGYLNTTFTISITSRDFTQLYVDMPVEGSVPENAYAYYIFPSESYGTNTDITVRSLTGDADVYVGCHDFPSVENATFSSRTASGDDFLEMYGDHSCEMEGNTYYIAVYGYESDSSGTIEFDISISQPYGPGSGSGSYLPPWGSSSGGWYSGSGYSGSGYSGSGYSGSGGGWWHSGSQSYWGPGSYSSGSGSGPGPGGEYPLSINYADGGIAYPNQYVYYSVNGYDVRSMSNSYANLVITSIDGGANVFMLCSSMGPYPTEYNYQEAAYYDQTHGPFVELHLGMADCAAEDTFLIAVTSADMYYPVNYTIGVLQTQMDSSWPLQLVLGIPQLLPVAPNGEMFATAYLYDTGSIDSINLHVQSYDGGIVQVAVSTNGMEPGANSKIQRKVSQGNPSYISIDPSSMMSSNIAVSLVGDSMGANVTIIAEVSWSAHSPISPDANEKKILKLSSM